ncbi:hypothetical protein A2780_00015 [Candidatus Daviesbacteria bacterium RIFCSPHIGHO2_01_FULL_41_45]|nr:MAG: hypothetical protein A2780_00015 [Candidatus Daviesbacteria bacterium RIFCSPHIGHO2_01_FULL_41_45]OGN22855.1 MAG: hypothetical protein A2915_01045 [Candidatus Yanofskybacteria bacterium RIFCSPLOWO2_01_FULL_41_34]
MKNLIFFLGGNDAEMVRIFEVLANAGIETVNKGLGWGAHASAYADEIASAGAEGKTVVLVELDNSSAAKTEWTAEKVAVTLPEGTIEVDHHGDRSAEPASILQVLKLIGAEPTHWDLLIAANDSGFIPAMEAMGATANEIAEVRASDRNAQGITPEKEAEAEQAIAKAETSDRLTVVRMAHSKCATVTDRLHKGAGGPGYDQLLILSGDGEVNFYGDGKLCQNLKEKFEGWNGGSGLGAEGGSAFWGGYPNHEEVLAFVKESL